MRLIIPDDWDGTSWCNWSVCWPDSPQWFGVLFGQITAPTIARLWDERTGVITDVQAIGIEILNNNTPLGGSIMSCNDGELLSEAIRYLADKLYDKTCCSVIQGAVGGPGSFGAPTTGPTSPAADPGETPPEGFDTIEEYRAYKCNVAAKIAADIATDTCRFSTLQLAGVTIVSLLPELAILLLDPIPGDELLALAGILIAVGSYGVGVLDNMCDAATAASDDLKCALYNAEGAENAKAEALVVLNAAMASETADEIAREYANVVWGFMLGWHNLNRLFEYDQIATTYPNSDCQDCAEIEGLQLVFFEDTGTLVSGQMVVPTGETNTFRATGEAAGAGSIPIKIAYNGYPETTDQFYITFCEVQGVTALSDGINADGNYVNDHQDGLPYRMREVNIRANAAGTYIVDFKVRYDQNPDGCA